MLPRNRPVHTINEFKRRYLPGTFKREILEHLDATVYAPMGRAFVKWLNLRFSRLREDADDATGNNHGDDTE